MQDNQVNMQRYEEDEIDLRELVKTIWNKKIMIIVITSLITIFAIVYSLVIPKTYEAKAVIEIGSIKHNNNNNNVALQNPSILVKKIEIKYIDNVDKKAKTILKSITTVKKAKELVQIVVHSDSPDSAKNMITDLISEIRLSHEKVIDNYVSVISKNIDNLKKQKKVLENNELKFEGSKQIEYELMGKINKLNLQISSVNIKHTELLSKITLSDGPIKPKKKLIVIVAFITGFILSIFLVFFLEFIKSFKEEETT